MRRLMQLGLTMVAVMGIGVMPMLAGSAAVGSIAGSRNATLSGGAAGRTISLHTPAPWGSGRAPLTFTTSPS